MKQIEVRFPNESTTTKIPLESFKKWEYEIDTVVGDELFCKCNDGTYFSIKKLQLDKSKDDSEHYRPLPDELTLDESEYLSNITGKKEIGLFAADDIDQGAMWLTHVKTDDPNFEDGLIRTPVGGFFNHNSEDPNCKTVHTEKYVYLTAIRDIKKGEELTAEYTLYNPEENG